MSRAIASARQRRAGLSAPEPPAPPASSVNANKNAVPNGMTLQQVIALIDSRLIKLETFMKESSSSSQGSSGSVHFSSNAASSILGQSIDMESSNLPQILDEYNSRFMLLAEEIASLKDTLMKLQGYTMDVNKMLLEERVNILSDLGDDKSMFVMEDASLAGGEIVVEEVDDATIE
jgi:hypothetical protein